VSRREKQHGQLAELEADLWRRLEVALERVAQGQNSLFFHTREFNPHDLADHMLPKESEELSAAASEALRLREFLGEPVEGSVGLAFRRALHRATDLADHHRLGPARMAEELLAELRLRREQ
jgi:hypothetical protein